MRPQLLAVHPVLACSDVERTIQFFAALGFACPFRDDDAAPRYAAVRRDAVEFHLQWHADAGRATGHDTPVVRILVHDVDTLFAEIELSAAEAIAAAHASPYHRPADTPWGTREFHLHDPDGNGLQFYASAAGE
ncbi:MAG: VOC family protein [Gemmatimonadaceae bacterium]|nr:VOC family protein [Gemmatimonadaceae bacterium]